MRKKRFSPLALLAAVVITILLTLGAVFLVAWNLLGRSGFAVVQGMLTVHRRFVGEYTAEDMADGALRGMVDGLGDRWSYYLTAEEYAEQNRRRENQYIGVGLTYFANEAGPMDIRSVTPGGPAAEAGLEAGDAIVAIEGTELTPENRSGLIAHFAGAVGDRVAVTVRKGNGSLRELVITLASIESDPVTYELLEGDVGYVRLANFYQRSAQRIREATEDLMGQGARGMIYDVRGNPGGFVSELTEMLDYLLPEGPIFTEWNKGGAVQVVESDESCVDLPMVVLVDADSYSAAELFAAQLRESAGAGLVGQVTSGKGFYQQAIELWNGGAMNISTGMYGTGAGESLRGVGLTPDILEDDPAAQLSKAVGLLREEMAGW